MVKATQLTFKDVEVNGRTRMIATTPEGSLREAVAHATVDPYGFYRAQLYNAKGGLTRTNLSAKSVRRMTNLKKSMVAYAKEYGSSEQAAAIGAMDAGRLAWMEEQGLIDAEEYFRYDDANVTPLGSTKKHGLEPHVQRYIDTYNALSGQMLEARREHNARTRARRASTA